MAGEHVAQTIDLVERAIRRAVGTYDRVLLERVNMRRIEDALAARDVEALRRELERAGVSRMRIAALQQQLVKAAKLGIRSLRVDLGGGIALPSRRAIDWAERRGAELVTAIDDETRTEIQSAVAEALDQGLSPQALRDGLVRIVPLHPRQVAALARRAETLSPAEQTDYAQALAYSRALTIARTEAARAVNISRHETLREARPTARIMWITADDEHVCPICEPRDREVQGVDDDWARSEEPPAHPNCRCRTVVTGKT
jgi:SPP1 gp7 family putative phage head morphogenesis protein